MNQTTSRASQLGITGVGIPPTLAVVQRMYVRISELSALLGDHRSIQNVRVMKRIRLRLLTCAKARRGRKSESASTKTVFAIDAVRPCTAAQITVLHVLRPVEG